MIGRFVALSELVPRMRMSAAVPGVPEPGMSVTPGDFDWSTSVTLLSELLSVRSSTSSVVTALPTVRCEVACGAPVTTTRSSTVAATPSNVGGVHRGAGAHGERLRGRGVADAPRAQRLRAGGDVRDAVLAGVVADGAEPRADDDHLHAAQRAPRPALHDAAADAPRLLRQSLALSLTRHLRDQPDGAASDRQRGGERRQAQGPTRSGTAT